jgi:hypothetical protein
VRYLSTVSRNIPQVAVYSQVVLLARHRCEVQILAHGLSGIIFDLDDGPLLNQAIDEALGMAPRVPVFHATRQQSA